MASRGPDPKIDQQDLENKIKQHHRPFVTANEVADSLDVARQTAHKHLQRLHEQGELNKRKVGGSAVIWWFDY
jgi:predicted ArsR family transcriptional regulator